MRVCRRIEGERISANAQGILQEGDSPPTPPEVRLNKRTGLPLKPRGFAAKSHPFHGKAREAAMLQGPKGRKKVLDLSILKALEGGAEQLSEFQWADVKNRVLLATVTDPSQHAGASLKAIEAMDKQREKAKYGTREAVESTLRKCTERMKELDAIEAGWVGRADGDAKQPGETTTGASNGA